MNTRRELEMPDPLQQLHNMPADPIELIRQGLEDSPDGTQWHRFTGWVRLAGNGQMLFDDLGLWVAE